LQQVIFEGGDNMANGNRIKVPKQPNLDGCKTNHEMIKVGFQYLFGVNAIIVNELNENRERDNIHDRVLEDHEGRIRENENKHVKIMATTKLFSKISAYTIGSGGLITLIILILKELKVL